MTNFQEYLEPDEKIIWSHEDRVNIIENAKMCFICYPVCVISLIFYMYFNLSF